ncbi:prepilin-type N-terminal cleavage/methylation domain-containing protein [Candidatus Palauibacter sp.]|uniref:prepilin-type N-terminal cleavage/methylation domain-containing protein n=1 Tax=Candidatus Palauibacter sp. TaxID=3101350 RepID=UPI003B598477
MRGTILTTESLTLVQEREHPVQQDGSSRSRVSHTGRSGFSLVEVAVALAVTGLAAAFIISREPLDRFSLTRAARVAESQLRLARLHAVATHAPTAVTLVGTRLEVSRQGGSLLSRVDLGRHTLGRLDSMRLQPSTLRFNARGHGSPGSVYLYRGDRGIRLVSNFVGRVRPVPFQH